MCDTLFHGLRQLLGENVVDVPKLHHMYTTYGGKKGDLWGRGFSVYCEMEDIPISREGIVVADFDYVICPIHHSMVGPEHAQEVKDFICRLNIPKEKLAVVDGWDREWLDTNLLDKCIYFKRELIDHYAAMGVKPIAFSIPKEKILSGQNRGYMLKEYMFAPLIPACHHWPDPGHKHLQTYTYDSEADYYQDYSRSCFAYTCKKGGWDCLRHYEIIAAGCIPYFTDIEACPRETLFNFPKDLCVTAKKLRGVYPELTEKVTPPFTTEKVVVGTGGNNLVEYMKINYEFDINRYTELLTKFMNYARQHLTTEAMAEYILNIITNKPIIECGQISQYETLR